MVKLKKKSNKNILLGAESLSAGNGGICRVARLMVRVISEKLNPDLINLCSLSLNDRSEIEDIKSRVILAKGSRLRYYYEAQKANLCSTHFIYDYVGMARGHCMIPFLRKPFMTWIHGIEIWEKARKDRILWAKRANVLLANTDYTKRRAENQHGQFDNIKVCWLGTETDELPDTSKMKNGPAKVLIIGRMDNELYKGHEALIDCWEKVVSVISDAQLIIVGHGPSRGTLMGKVLKSPVCNGIKFCGFVPEEKMEEIWAEATIFAMPSRGEGFGLVYIEAMRHGLPIVASIHDAAPEINIDGKTGFNVNLDRPDELPDRIIHLLKNRDMAFGMGKIGQKHWKRNFCYSSFKNRFTPILMDFLN